MTTDAPYTPVQPPPIRTSIDALFEQYQNEGLFDGLHPDDRNRLLNVLNPVRLDAVSLKTEVMTIDVDRNLSSEGRSKKRQEAIQRGKALADRWQFAKLKATIENERATLEGQAAQGWIGSDDSGYIRKPPFEMAPSREAVLLTLLYQSEAKEPGTVAKLYRDGGDPELTHVVEHAAFESFALVKPADLEYVRKQRLEAAPAAVRLRLSQFEEALQAVNSFSTRSLAEIEEVAQVRVTPLFDQPR